MEILGKDNRQWWTTRTVEKPPLVSLGIQQRPLQGTTHPQKLQGEITLRKTIVSHAALREQKIPFKEDGKYVRVLRDLDAAAVEILRARSEEMCGSEASKW